jgi:hypothetical protein
MRNEVHSRTVSVFKNKRFLTLSLYVTLENTRTRHDCHFKQQKSIAVYWSEGLPCMTKAHTYRLSRTMAKFKGEWLVTWLGI